MGEEYLSKFLGIPNDIKYKWPGDYVGQNMLYTFTYTGCKLLYSFVHINEHD